MSTNEELRILAYRQTLLEKVDEYEGKIIDLRVEITRKSEQIESLNAQNAELAEKVRELELQGHQREANNKPAEVIKGETVKK
jgi:SMC interacting uncharacterized protein involved in chromosome segregation